MAVRLVRQQVDFCVAVGLLIEAGELFEPIYSMARSAMEFGLRAYWLLEPSATLRQRCARGRLMELVSVHLMRDAVKHAAAEAKLGEGAYEVRVVPKPKNIVELLMAGATEDAAERRRVGVDVGAGSLVEAAAPYLKALDPVRVAAVRAALVRLEMHGGEAVLVAMPEVVVRD